MIFMSTWQVEGRRTHWPNWIDWFPVQECIIDGFENEEGGVLMVDVAGGRGHDLKKFQAMFPRAPGRLIVDDLPQVLEGISLSPRIECQQLTSLSRSLSKVIPPRSQQSYSIKLSLESSRCPSILYEIRHA